MIKIFQFTYLSYPVAFLVVLVAIDQPLLSA
jgi:hypothetical protein